MFHKQGAPLSLVLWAGRPFPEILWAGRPFTEILRAERPFPEILRAGRPFPEILWARDISTLILQEQGTPLSRDPMGEGYPLPKILWPGDRLSRNTISKAIFNSRIYLPTKI